MSVKQDGYTREAGLLPTLGKKLRRERVRITEFGGLSSRGVLGSMTNLSPRGRGALATRLPRGLKAYARGDGAPHGMIYFDGSLIFARGTGLYRGGADGSVAELGVVSETRKVFFIFGDYLYIYPDKLRLGRGESMPQAIELSTGVISQSTFNGNVITLPKGYTWLELGFAPGDGLRVRSEDDVNPAPEGYYRIREAHGREAVLVSATFSNTDSDASFWRVVPALEGACVSGGRVYGFAGKEIYISAAGSATDFFSGGAPDGEDPLVLSTHSEGDLTACVPWQGYVVFFKSDRICKLLGTRSDSFTLQEMEGAGIPASLADTLCEVDGGLYYCSGSGVYRYRGQEPDRIAPPGSRVLSDGCGGTDGVAYYLAVETAEGWSRYLYRPDTDTWYAEDEGLARGMIPLDGYLCFQDGEGRIWQTSSEGRAHGCGFSEEQVAGPVEACAVFSPDHFGEPDGYRMVGLYIRATGRGLGSLRVLISYADGRASVDADPGSATLVGEFTGNMTDRLLRIPLSPRFCDSGILRLELVGDWVIHAVIREYEVAGQ